MSAVAAANRARRRRKHVVPGAEIFPAYSVGAKKSWLYAVMYSGGLLKVGRTHTPRDRIRQYTQHHRGFNRTIEWVHLFAPVETAAIKFAERAAINALAHVALRDANTEWFRTNASREQVIAAIRRGLA